MLKLCIDVSCTITAEPIVTCDGQLLGVELLTRVDTGGLIEGSLDMERFISKLELESKKTLLKYQLEKVESKKKFFLLSGLICSINIDFDIANMIIKDEDLGNKLKSLPFVRLEISEKFPNLADGLNNTLIQKLHQEYILWLDDLGSGNSDIQAVKTGVFEYIKIDKKFYWAKSSSYEWPIIIKSIKQYCHNIIVEGVENHNQLKKIGRDVTGIQGYIFESVEFSDIESLTINRCYD